MCTHKVTVDCADDRLKMGGYYIVAVEAAEGGPLTTLVLCDHFDTFWSVSLVILFSLGCSCYGA